MIARFTIERPDEVEATIKFTMSIKEWGELLDQLNSEWPSSGLSRGITNLLTQVKRVICSQDVDAFS